MLNCRNSSSSENTEMSVLERQRVRLNWQQEQSMQHQPAVTYFRENEQFDGVLGMGNKYDHDLGELFMSRAMKPDPDFEYGWNDLSYGNGSEFEMSRCTSQTTSCPPPVAAAVEEEAAKVKESALISATGKERFKKRKSDKAQNLKAVTEENFQEKKMKGCTEDQDSKTTDQYSNSKSTITTANDNSNKDDSKENSKVSEVPKPDYIHVRARRGQATDSHSLAARFSSRMQQDYWESWNAGRNNQLCSISSKTSRVLINETSCNQSRTGF